MKKRNNASNTAGYTLKQRFEYWFDNRMAKGSLGFIRVLIIATVLLALLIAGLILLFGLQGEEEEPGAVLWNSVATVINAWMPYFDEGGPGYLILMTVTALAGVLFTSVLIGIVTSSIEEKINDLKRGNSLVLEKDHTVVLGYAPGEYSLIRQLVLAAGGKPACVVVAEDMERAEMEQDLQSNVDLPKNFRVICRTVDITDPVSLERCAIPTCRSVIIQPTDDVRTVKATLAVSALLQQQGITGVRVSAIVSKARYRFPSSLAESHNISALPTNEVIARMIAHSCTQTGLSEAFREIFNFEGSEFFVMDLPQLPCETFGELALRLDRAVPAGILREGKTVLNPPADYGLAAGDRIIVFAENAETATVEAVPPEGVEIPPVSLPPRQESSLQTVIIGHNETLRVILQEMPENVRQVLLVSPDLSPEEQESLEEAAAQRGMELQYSRSRLRTEKSLNAIAQSAAHIVILNDHDKDPEEADMETIFLLLNLRDLRDRYQLRFNITAEMQKEHNQNLIAEGDNTDFLVSSSMSSLILAQLAESPELLRVFQEILSNRGSELFVKNAGEYGMAGEHTVQELRRLALARGFVLLGTMDEHRRCTFNPPLHGTVALGPGSSIIVLAES